MPRCTTLWALAECCSQGDTESGQQQQGHTGGEAARRRPCAGNLRGGQQTQPEPWKCVGTCGHCAHRRRHPCAGVLPAGHRSQPQPWKCVGASGRSRHGRGHAQPSHNLGRRQHCASRVQRDSLCRRQPCASGLRAGEGTQPKPWKFDGGCCHSGQDASTGNHAQPHSDAPLPAARPLQGQEVPPPLAGEERVGLQSRGSLHGRHAHDSQPRRLAAFAPSAPRGRSSGR
mmetsp:Transcript_51213/g.158850  ORF Transcript_51213/g.158850 Transcript_51213/m.158850 type:complete len:229 (+) Transcript_51213:183-869(+)